MYFGEVVKVDLMRVFHTDGVLYMGEQAQDVRWEPGNLIHRTVDITGDACRIAI